MPRLDDFPRRLPPPSELRSWPTHRTTPHWLALFKSKSDSTRRVRRSVTPTKRTPRLRAASPDGCPTRRRTFLMSAAHCLRIVAWFDLELGPFKKPVSSRPADGCGTNKSPAD